MIMLFRKRFLAYVIVHTECYGNAAKVMAEAATLAVLHLLACTTFAKSSRLSNGQLNMVAAH